MSEGSVVVRNGGAPTGWRSNSNGIKEEGGDSEHRPQTKGLDHFSILNAIYSEYEGESKDVG
jgi:hypothetical protein